MNRERHRAFAHVRALLASSAEESKRLGGLPDKHGRIYPEPRDVEAVVGPVRAALLSLTTILKELSEHD